MPIQLNKGRALDSLNLTPLIDVVFLLLIFFLVATQFSQDDQQLPIKLPSARNALPMTVVPEELVVNIGADGTYMVRGERVNAERLEAILAQSVADNPVQQTVILRGDRRTEFQSVVTVIDICNRVKVPSYRITTSKDEPPASPNKAPNAP
ncbi:MAG: ExbD/TolR family protein [Pirellula sp.]